MQKPHNTDLIAVRKFLLTHPRPSPRALDHAAAFSSSRKKIKRDRLDMFVHPFGHTLLFAQ